MLRACDWCGASGNTKLCGGCRTKWFCDNDKKCLKAAWKNGHKQECKAAKAEQDIKESEEQDSKPQMPVEQFDDIHPLLEILRIGFGEPAERAGMHTVLFLWRMRRLSKEFLIWANKILSQQPYLTFLAVDRAAATAPLGAWNGSHQLRCAGRRACVALFLACQPRASALPLPDGPTDAW
eukprot:COSAG06_NODE_624_length_13686_cov_86.804666_12_plen_180_part_00